MRTSSIAVLGIAAYAIFLAATIPARFVAQRLASPGEVEISEARGTLWSGSARATIFAGAAPLAIDRIRWRFQPARLASARLAFAVEASGPGLEADGEVERGFGALGARDVHARADAAAIAALIPLAASWRPEGAVTLAAPGLVWDGRDARGEARLEWRDASLAIAAVRPLGSYRIEARAEGGPARITVATLDGPLRIAGSGTFAPPAALQFAGEARGEGPSAGALEPLLNLIGPRRADGARTFEWHTPSTPSPPRR